MVALLGLQVGLLLTFRLSLFPWIMMAATWGFVPGSFWQPGHLGSAVSRLPRCVRPSGPSLPRR